jgi:hypothetical protein
LTEKVCRRVVERNPVGVQNPKIAS